MKKTLRIADSNFNYSKFLFNSFKNQKNSIDILGITTDGEETLQMIKKDNPNFLILDLNMSKLNGFEILKAMEQLKNCTTKVIIISDQINMINTLNCMEYKKIINIFIKPFAFLDLYNSIEKCTKKDENDIEMLEHIDNILHEFSFNFSSKFYEYLILCINKTLYNSFTLCKIYKIVAKEQKINPNRLKWGIDKLILSMNRYTPNEVLKKYIPYTKNITPKIFISEIVKRIKREIN